MVAEVNRLNGVANTLAEESQRQRAQATVGADPQPLFSDQDLEQLAFRRFNPYANLTAATLSSALDAYENGEIFSAARIWARIAKSDPTINTVKPKREEAVSLRPISTRPKDESPAAADQAAFLKSFYDNAQATHATKRHVIGKASLFLEQMMESVAFEYAAHHIIWRPNAAQLVTLPSGQKVPSLSATFEYVPLEFFEARTGALRFLGLNNFYNGEPLEPNNWLVTTGPGLMFAGCILHYLNRLARHDLVNFSEKFGQPGTLVHTTAQQGTEEGKAAFKLAQSLAANYRGVLYGAAENKAEYLWPQGGVAGEGLPMHVLGKDIKQEIISMWMGADLSTMSRGGGSEQPVVGASVQGLDQDKKERKDGKRMGDTLNASIDPLVLRWGFGNNAPILAEAFIDFPDNEDRAQLGESVTLMVNAGAQVPVEPVAKRLGVPIAKEGEKVFEKPEPALPPEANVQRPTSNAQRSTKKTATNSESLRERGAAVSPEEDMKRFLGPYANAFAGDMQPLRTAMEAVLSPDDIDFDSKVAWLREQLPSLLTEINQSPKSAEVLETIIRGAFERGYTQAAEERKAA